MRIMRKVFEVFLRNNGTIMLLPISTRKGKPIKILFEGDYMITYDQDSDKSVLYENGALISLTESERKEFVDLVDRIL